MLGAPGQRGNQSKNPTLIRVYYYLPDYSSLLQEFVWQTLDIPPQFYRVHKFLNYWKDNIEATISEVEVSYVERSIGDEYIKKYIREVF